MTTWGNWKTWAILIKDPETGDYTRLIAAFSTRKLCEEYINFKKEQCFFETGSMDEAENRWGMNNFLIDYTMLLDRATIVQEFYPVDFGRDWSNV